MTTLQRIIITTVLAAAAATAIYEAKQANQAHDELHTLRQQQTLLSERNRELIRELDDASNRLTRTAQEWAPSLAMVDY